MTCSVCGKPGKKWQGIKRVLCEECARAAFGNESYRRGIVHKSPEGWLKEHGHLPADHGYDPYEGVIKSRQE